MKVAAASRTMRRLLLSVMYRNLNINYNSIGYGTVQLNDSMFLPVWTVHWKLLRFPQRQMNCPLLLWRPL